MATTRMTLAEIKARGSVRDLSRLRATSEAEIRRQMVEDGQDPQGNRTWNSRAPHHTPKATKMSRKPSG